MSSACRPTTEACSSPTPRPCSSASSCRTLSSPRSCSPCPTCRASAGPNYVNYRDLSVQQLGSIYERILEFGLRLDPDSGEVVVDRDDAERHDSGSYYTPEALVSLIIERAVGPAVAARSQAFTAAAERLAGDDRRPVHERLVELATFDPASALLELKVCDPAMGSGHFLVSLVDWLADQVLAALAEASAQVAWVDYASPLLARVAGVRERILGEARAHGWPVTPEQLDDRHVVRRMILKRVVHGVDKNPFAVELAKVSLWLHTFTVGAPLSFLDHHLRCGDSIVGAWVRPTLDAVAQGGGLLAGNEIARVEGIAAAMTGIEQTTDNDVAEVRASAHAYGAVARCYARAGRLLQPDDRPPGAGRRPQPRLKGTQGHAGAAPRGGSRAAEDRHRGEAAGGLRPRGGVQGGAGRQYGDPLKIAAGELTIDTPEDDDAQPLLGALGEGVERRRRAAALVAQARALTAHERFLHWPVAFPNVWRRLTQAVPEGGFDAVIGNPPYVRQERLAAVKPALAAGYDTFAGTADLYVYFFEQGLRLVRPGGRVAYVVTNKWLKAGYAEELRAMLVDPEAGGDRGGDRLRPRPRLFSRRRRLPQRGGDPPAGRDARARDADGGRALARHAPGRAPGRGGGGGELLAGPRHLQPRGLDAGAQARDGPARQNQARGGSAG